MKLMSYWPTNEHIRQCIRTEAEELAEHSLLAVHEPMKLVKQGLGEGDTRESCSDEDLLKSFLTVERPVPIIGNSGVGKSHLIRWLDAKLRVHPESVNWHIVRIPKNASLRQVLDLLLDGLDGKDFEDAREKVRDVSETLNTYEVAEHLLTFMSQQMRRLFDEAQIDIENIRRSGKAPTEEEKVRLSAIRTHASASGLQALIIDPNFRTNLLQPSHCIYQFASRMTSGATDDELSVNEYQVRGSDLDFSYNLNDLAKESRDYVKIAQLNTSPSSRETAATVLNWVLGDATRRAFQQLFQFGGGSFQDLFKQIRRDLFNQGKTLVILVEDMAAISAIEDVLIDSLLEESMRDGTEQLCSLRSAIAVTHGYAGYRKRGDTIRTRVGAEWIIEEVWEEEDEQTCDRIVDFCSRYINAARYGHDDLEKIWESDLQDNWPPPWSNEEIDREYLDAFGYSSIGVPLYPLNRSAINALVDKVCRDEQGRIHFNPRLIINKVLLQILRDCRPDAEQDLFPPPNLAGISAYGGLRSDLSRLGLSHPERCETVSAIWGFGSENLEELQKCLSADIALCFGLPDLAGKLKGGSVETKPKPQKNKKEPTKEKIIKPHKIDERDEKLRLLMVNIDLWCRKEKQLGQEDARTLRSALAKLYRETIKKDWFGVSDVPAITVGKSERTTLINLPFAAGNNVASMVPFCSETIFSHPQKSILYHDAARALLRHSYHNKENEGTGWSYADGHKDFLAYQNFAARWVLEAFNLLKRKEEKDFQKAVVNNIHAAHNLAILNKSDSHRDYMHKLLISADDIRESLTTPVCDKIEEIRESTLSQWDDLRDDWLKHVASNDHCLDGDIVLSAIRKAVKTDQSSKLRQNVNQASRELQSVLNQITLFGDCTCSEDFTSSLNELHQLVNELNVEGRFPTDEVGVTSKTFIKNLQKVQENGTWNQVKKMLEFSKTSDPLHQWQLLNLLDKKIVESLSKLLENWAVIYERVMDKLRLENERWGTDSLRKADENMDQLLSDLMVSVQFIGKEVKGDDAK